MLAQLLPEYNCLIVWNLCSFCCLFVVICMAIFLLVLQDNTISKIKSVLRIISAYGEGIITSTPNVSELHRIVACKSRSIFTP